jgi:hypothetical protein
MYSIRPAISSAKRYPNSCPESGCVLVIIEAFRFGLTFLSYFNGVISKGIISVFMLSVARSPPILDRDAQNFQTSMEDDFEESFESYTKCITVPGRHDQNRPYNSSFEDVTQLSSQGGGLGEIFKTSEKQSRDSDGRKWSTKGKFDDVSLLLRRIYRWDSTRGETWTVRLQI